MGSCNRKCSAANSGAVNQRLDEAVAAGRVNSSATWKVSDLVECTEWQNPSEAE